MAYTTPKTWAVGNVLTASDMNTYVRDNAAFLYGPPSCRAYNDADISIANNSVTALTFNSERWDTDTMHDLSTNTGRLTCKTAGIYHIYANVQFAANDTGYRTCTIRLGGSTVIGAMSITEVSDVAQRLIVSTEYPLAVNDYVEVTVYQNSGDALNVTASANYSPEFGMTWLRGPVS